MIRTYSDCDKALTLNGSPQLITLIKMAFDALNRLVSSVALHPIGRWPHYHRPGAKEPNGRHFPGNTSGGANVSALTYAYDNDDNMLSITDGVDATRSTSFAFDSMNRISRIDNAGSSGIKREDQLHDRNGNRVRVERRALATDVTPASTDTYTTTAGTNRLASIAAAAGTRALAYDARGNLATETRPGAVSATTSYDGYARLTSYVRTGEASLAFTYNGMDDRVREVRGTATQRYVYDGAGRVLGEYGASATDVAAEYLWLSPDAANDNQPFGGDDGVGGYAPLAISSAPTGGTAQIFWVHSSHMGVPLAYTSTTGAEVAPPSFTQIAFPGQMRTLPDLYYNRYRAYDPTTGRYIQADPIGLAGDTNPYAYAMNNPLKYSDPSGLFADIVLRMIRDNIARQIGDAATKATNSVLDDIFPPETQCRVPNGDGDDDGNDRCEQQYERDIGRCTSARIKYGREGFKLCASSALRRK